METPEVRFLSKRAAFVMRYFYYDEKVIAQAEFRVN